MPGVSGIVLHDGLLTCQLEGDVGPFLAAIAGLPVTDLTIEPAHLEEAFLEFYEGDGGNGTGAADEADPSRREPGAIVASAPRGGS
ncbi:MAG: hypothetical protein ACXWW6_02300 [Candidatus Limnocylindrales bacterium]